MNNRIVGQRELSDIIDLREKTGFRGIVLEGEKIEKNDVGELLISPGCIQERIEYIAEYISDDNAGEIYLIAILEGGIYFAKGLETELKGIGREVTLDTMKISSYKKNKSTGKITKHKDCNDLTGKRVIVVEDIVDTGTSFKMIVDYLKNEKHAESVEFCSLLDKPEGRKPRNKNISLDYTGFIVPKLFVYGYGLDINGEHRELKGVYYKE